MTVVTMHCQHEIATPENDAAPCGAPIKVWIGATDVGADRWYDAALTVEDWEPSCEHEPSDETRDTWPEIAASEGLLHGPAPW